MGRLSWLELLLILDTGPLDEVDRRLVRYARRSYSKLSGDRQTVAELKALVARTLEIVNHGTEPNRIAKLTQEESDSLLRVF